MLKYLILITEAFLASFSFYGLSVNSPSLPINVWPYSWVIKHHVFYKI